MPNGGVEAKEERLSTVGGEEKVLVPGEVKRNRAEATKTVLHSGWLGVSVYEWLKRTGKEGARGSSPRKTPVPLIPNLDYNQPSVA